MNKLFIDTLSEDGTTIIRVEEIPLHSASIQEALEELNKTMRVDEERFKPDRPQIYDRMDQLLKKRKSRK